MIQEFNSGSATFRKQANRYHFGEITMRSPLALATVAVLLAACGSQPPAPEQKPAAVEGRTPSAVVRSEPVAPIKAGDAFDPMSVAALKDPRSPLSKRVIHFEYDSYVVKDEYQPLLSAHSKFLGAHPSIKMLVQGHADDRGSREYNLALGQKRADAVRKSLSLMGAREDQMESVSLGKEKGVCSDATEECWTQNRRAEMLYSGEF